MISLEHISFAYGKKLVLQDFSLSFATGKTTCLIGSSGSGKTSILRLLAGLEKPLEGQVLLNGKIVSENGQILVPPAQRRIGFIFQDLALWPHFKVYRNIAFGLEEQGQQNIAQKVKEVLELFKIDNQAYKYPHQLSGGQKQLVALARAFVLNPGILLMDEPLSNLDIIYKKEVLNYIKKLQENYGITIIYVTHDAREAFAIADEIVFLENGKPVAKGTPNEIKQSDNQFIKKFIAF